MLGLDDDKWKSFYGGYGLNYDVSEPLKRLQAVTEPNEEIWQEFWEELHHQGDVGTASYAAIPHIYRIYKDKNWIDWNLPAIASVIEESRLNERNPKLPEWLEKDYFDGLKDIVNYCLEKNAADLGKDFSRSVLLLTAILLKDIPVHNLLETIQIGDEEKVLELYYES